MRVSPLGVTVLVAWGCLAPASVVSAQSIGNIAGTVSDGSGGVVPGAMVTARNQGTGAVREVLTDNAGRSSAAAADRHLHRQRLDEWLPDPGSEVVLEVQASVTLDFALEISSMTSEVTVTSVAETVELQRSDASLGQLINAQQVAELPLNGRNFVQLAFLGPGTVTGRAGSFLAQGPSSEVSIAAACRCRRRACARTPTTGCTTASTTTS